VSGPHFDQASLAHGAVNHAQGVLRNIRADDLVMARGHASLLLQDTKELLRWLGEQTERLPEPEWMRHLHNPYETIYLSGPTTEDGLRRLSDERLLEYCRGTNWSREHAKDGMARWWLSKAMSRAKRELRARGLDPELWRDGTEAE
jgi:hypothetical protein